MDLRERRDVSGGFGDGLAKAFELVLTPAIFTLGGLALDRWLGLVPLFTVGLTVFALCGVGYMSWFRYEADMRREEDELRARRDQARHPVRTTAPAPPGVAAPVAGEGRPAW